MRFMPELLFFLFAVARAHVSDKLSKAGLLSALEADTHNTRTRTRRKKERTKEKARVRANENSTQYM